MKKNLLLFAAFGILLSGCNIVNTQPRSTDGIGKPAGDNNPAVTSGSTVDLSGKNMSSLSTAIFNQSGVTSFNVSGNRLTGALPSEMGKWKGLESLDASNNQMTGIPAEIGQLRNLKVIDYGKNQIDTMPNEIAELANLERLSLAGNLYREVPQTLLQLPKLGTLDLSGNRIAKLPENLLGWKNLRVLNLTGNPLASSEIERARGALPNTEINF
ncbi:leucine-rich repeat domain-containing protein [Candidatus Falkowbacteria bacterium]|nr:leucine-rich repeat domain-containing protein [Candidatus Falkowbacteria bacterium]